MHLRDSWGLRGGPQKPEFQEKEEGQPHQGKEGSASGAQVWGGGTRPSRRVTWGYIEAEGGLPAVGSMQCSEQGTITAQVGRDPTKVIGAAGCPLSQLYSSNTLDMLHSADIPLLAMGPCFLGLGPSWPTTGHSRSPSCLGGKTHILNQRLTA